MTAATPAQLDELFSTYRNAGDVDGLVSLYEPEAVLTRIGREIRGSEALRQEFVAESLKEKGRRRLFPVDIRVVVAAELAFHRVLWRFEDTKQSGEVIINELIACEVSRLQSDGTWKFIIDDAFPMSGLDKPTG